VSLVGFLLPAILHEVPNGMFLMLRRISMLDENTNLIETTSEDVIIKADNQLTIYAPIISQLAEISKINESLVFDYSTAKGEKEARSHVYKLKRFKTQAENARKAATAEARAYTELVNKTGKSVLEKIEQMIQVHMAPIQAKESREAERRHKIEAEIQKIRDLFVDDFMTAKMASQALESSESIQIDSNFFQEYTQTAEQAKAEVIAKLKQHIIDVAEREKAAEQALKAREAERIKAMELRIQSEAEAKAKAIIEEAKRKEAEAKEQAEKAMKEAELAKLKAEKAIEDERKARFAEQQRILDEESKRAADVEHRRKVNWDAVNALIAEVPMTEEMAKKVIKSIVSGKIPRVTLNY
jgi:hypothetical protein